MLQSYYSTLADLIIIIIIIKSEAYNRTILIAVDCV